MIAIANDSGDFLQLDPDQNLVTELATAWLSDDELPGEFSYSVEAPLNENNKRFTRNGYRPDRSTPQTQMAVTVSMGNTLFRRCTYSYRVNNGKLSGFLKIDSSEFYDKIRKLTLLEALPDQVALGDGLVSTPPVDLSTRLHQIAALPPGQFPCTFFPIRNRAQIEEGFDETKLAGFTRNDYINAWEPLSGGGFGFPIDLPNMPKFGYLICPQFYLSWVLERIMNLAGYRIESDWLASEEVQRYTVENLTAMSMAENGLGGFIEGHIITAGMFLPDTTVSDFLKAIKGRFGLVFTYNANLKVCRITQFTGAVALGPAIDLTPFQSGAYSTDYPDGNGFSVTDYIDEADALYKNAAGETIPSTAQITGLGGTQVTLKAGTSQLANEKSPLGANCFWLVPTVQQPGNVLDPNYKQSSSFLTKEGKRPNSIGIKLLSYRGMTVDSAGHPYPLGTPDNRNGRQEIVGTQALTLGGRSGSWRSYLRAYYYFRDQTQKVTQPLLLPAAILSTLERDRSVSLTLEDQIRRSYLISKIRADQAGSDGLARVQLEVLTLPAGIDQLVDVDSAVVWVELKIETTNWHDEGTGGVITGDHTTAKLTLLFWADANRSVPAVVTNLAVNLRSKQTGKREFVAGSTGQADQTYVERIVSYSGNGTSTVVENGIYIRDYIFDTSVGRNFALIDYTLVLAVDPGEGYNILV